MSRFFGPPDGACSQPNSCVAWSKARARFHWGGIPRGRGQLRFPSSVSQVSQVCSRPNGNGPTLFTARSLIHWFSVVRLSTHTPHTTSSSCGRCCSSFLVCLSIHTPQTTSCGRRCTQDDQTIEQTDDWSTTCSKGCKAKIRLSVIVVVGGLIVPVGQCVPCCCCQQ